MLKEFTTVVFILLMVLSAVLLALATLGVGGSRFNLVSGGLFCYVLAQLLTYSRFI